MTTFAVLGGTGFTGRLVLDELARRGHRTVLGGREPDRVRASAPPTLELRSVHRVDVTDRASLDSFLATSEPDALLTTVGPFDDLGREVVAAAATRGVPYVDCSGEQPFIRWCFDEWGPRARDAGVPMVPAAGFDFVPGDLLSAVACRDLGGPLDVNVSYALPRVSDLVFGWSRGTRRSLVRMLAGDHGVTRRDGRLVPETIAGDRRQAWFPRPVGPHHAVAITGGEALTVPRHVSGARTVGTYLAVPSLLAEVLQAAASLARRERGARVLARIAAATADPSPGRRRATRWACVAQAMGHDSANGPVRAWAYGRDLYAFTAAAMVLAAERLVQDTSLAGVLAPAQLAPPEELLDELATRTQMRWSVQR